MIFYRLLLVLAAFWAWGVSSGQAAPLDVELVADVRGIAPESRNKVLGDTLELLKRRAKFLGMAGFSADRSGEKMRIRAPNVKDAEKAREILTQPIHLSFHEVVEAEDAKGPAAKGLIERSERPSPKQPPRKFLLRPEAIVDPVDVETAALQMTPYGPAVGLTLTRVGAQKFARATQRLVGKRIAIVLDEKILSAPTVRESITGGQIQITGAFSETEADELAGMIALGALAVPLEPPQTKIAAPTQPDGKTLPPIKVGPRLALVIGNAAYKQAPLKNPVNDARAMTKQLQALGFEVMSYENASNREMNRAMVRFGEKLAQRGGTGLFFFAGHGLQVSGHNFLVPVDAEIDSQRAVRAESIDLETVLDQMAGAGNELNMVILDACRNNPFGGARGASGLAGMDAPKGMLIAYATAPGKVASDGASGNGLYTQMLLKHLGQPGLRVEDVFKRVRAEVAKATEDSQMPWESSSLMGDFYFAGPPR